VKYINTEINLQTVSQFPARLAILKIEARTRARTPRLLLFCHRNALRAGMLKLFSVEQVAPALETIVASSLRRSSDAALLAWPLTCGSAVAARTRAVEFSGGILKVEVPDTGWRFELQRLAPQYLAAINRYVSKPVTYIEFITRSLPHAGQATAEKK
jgi:hypothetical protein